MTHSKLRKMICFHEEAAIIAIYLQLVESSGLQLIGLWWKEAAAELDMVPWIEHSHISRQNLEECVCVNTCI